MEKILKTQNDMLLYKINVPSLSVNVPKICKNAVFDGQKESDRFSILFSIHLTLFNMTFCDPLKTLYFNFGLGTKWLKV